MGSTFGIPREVLVDNMKQAVESHDVVTGRVCWNRSFLDFSDHHSFLPVACPPYWPQAKGKVERGVGYIQPTSTGFMDTMRLLDIEQVFTSYNNPKGNADVQEEMCKRRLMVK